MFAIHTVQSLILVSSNSFLQINEAVPLVPCDRFHPPLETVLKCNTMNIKSTKLLEVSLLLNTRKAPGTDMLPNLMLTECTVSFCDPLFIFNKSIIQGYFPKKWNHLFVIQRRGSYIVGNYLQVCIQSAMLQVFVKMVIL